MSNHAAYTIKDAVAKVRGGTFRGTLRYYEGVTDHFGIVVEDDAITFSNVKVIIPSPDMKADFTEDDFDDFFALYYEEFYNDLYSTYIASNYAADF